MKKTSKKGFAPFVDLTSLFIFVVIIILFFFLYKYDDTAKDLKQSKRILDSYQASTDVDTYLVSMLDQPVPIRTARGMSTYSTVGAVIAEVIEFNNVVLANTLRTKYIEPYVSSKYVTVHWKVEIQNWPAGANGPYCCAYDETDDNKYPLDSSAYIPLSDGSAVAVRVRYGQGHDPTVDAIKLAEEVALLRLARGGI